MPILRIKNKTYINQLIWVILKDKPESHHLTFLQAGETRSLVFEDNQTVIIRDRSPFYEFKSSDYHRMSRHFEFLTEQVQVTS
ncbi:hypothetical protein SAMN02910293_01043 [Streptococcus henryi]|jgi:hypothetical protein|uniref:Uncharacterized protein n=1 Tax=Streptococcus henryi TaxID=439219 RepID=A0A1G6BIP7_9STRE|nr:hypothetical protein [Streptococcus henryi]SDB20478.1 hypothetical protein SAMN02910293_01043 [Streptococcus henryi]